MERVLRALADDPERITISDPREELTAGRVLDEVHRTGRALLARGAGPGAVVALSGPISARMYVLSQALRLVGAAQMDVPTSLPAQDQADLLAECGCDLLVIDPEQTGTATVGTLSAVPGLDVCALSSSDQADDLFAQAQDHSAAPFPSRARQGDPRQIALTSGTTGRPKPVVRTFAPAPPAGPSWLTGFLHPDEGPSRLLLTQRLSGLMQALADTALASGTSVITRPEPTVPELMATVASERITHVPLSAHELRGLLAADAADADLSSLKGVIIGGSSVPPALLRRAVERLGPIVHALYGQTEAGNLALLSPGDYTPWDDAAARSVGRLCPGVDVRIRPVDGQDGQKAHARERGKVSVRTPRLMDGYLNRPEETGRVLRDGWLDTGDIGYFDEAGRLMLLGRARDAMTIGEHTVFPTEIDIVLQEHPAVRDSVTYDVTGPDGTELHSVFVPGPGPRPDEGDLLRRVEQRMGPALTPASITASPRIPYTFTSEPCRRTLRQSHIQARSTVAHADPRS